jgi:hypothetical protein
MKKVAVNLQPLFWDVNIKEFNPKEHPDYTISRVLEFGDEAAFAWIKTIFSDTQIKNTIKSTRQISRKSANFWGIIYSIPPDEINVLR